MKYSGQINDLAAFPTDYPCCTNTSLFVVVCKKETESSCLLIAFLVYHCDMSGSCFFC